MRCIIFDDEINFYMFKDLLFIIIYFNVVVLFCIYVVIR